MTVAFDQDSGRLRLDADCFDALTAIASGREPAAEAYRGLREAGLVDERTVHPIIAPALLVLENPTAQAQISMVDDAGRWWGGSIWIGAESAVFLMSTGAELDELIITGPTFFPLSIARIVGLGPRRNPKFHGWSMATTRTEELVSADASARQQAAAELRSNDADTRSFISSIVSGPWHYWTLDARWQPASGKDGRRPLHVLDTSQAMAILSPEGKNVSVDPLTPSEVWLLLTMILPDDDELAAGEAD